jgi:cell division protein FtsA
MKFKTAMDVRIGLPNEHLTGSARNEINQPMYATSVGLIMRGFEYIETYKKSFSAGRQEDFIRPSRIEVIEKEEAETEADIETTNDQQESKTSLTDKIKMMMSKMFEVEDQTIN